MAIEWSNATPMKWLRAPDRSGCSYSIAQDGCYLVYDAFAYADPTVVLLAGQHAKICASR
jgi:hypothetical protein